MVQSIDPEGIPPHKNPIPAGAIHRGFFASSAISGKDFETGIYPEDKEEQIALAFKYFEMMLAAGGATLQDVIKVELFFRDKADRKFANPHWLRLYPDEAHRPARHAHIADLLPGCYLQIEFLAVVGE